MGGVMTEEITVERIELGEVGLYFFRWTGTSLGDTISGYDSEINRIYGGAGADLLMAGRQTQINGNNLYGGEGDDTLNGGLGSDTLDGGIGADVMRGGRGSDLYIVDDPGDVVIEKLAWASDDYGDTVLASVDYSLSGTAVKRLTLSDDVPYNQGFFGTGNDLDNIIRGNKHRNILDGGKGIDTLIGGDGDDRYLMRHPRDQAIEYDVNGKEFDHDTIFAFCSFKIPRGIEDIFLQDMIGKTGQPVQGLTAIGHESANYIHGNAYDNTLQGRGGHDTLVGGAGADDFVFTMKPSGENNTLIWDFGNGDDRILIRAAVLPGMSKGPLDDEAFRLGPRALDASDRFIFDGRRLWFDADGNGEGKKLAVAILYGPLELTADDIFII